MANEKIYEMVTNKIVEQLEKGVVPWRKPWVNGGAVSWNLSLIHISEPTRRS